MSQIKNIIFLQLIKKYQFLIFFIFITTFLVIFYFTILIYFNNLIQNYNFVDEVPNAQTIITNNNNNYFHSFLTNNYKNYGIYNLRKDNQSSFNGNINHLLNYNNDNLKISAWKNEIVNAQLILIKKDAKQILNNLTVVSMANSQINIETRWTNFVDAYDNHNNITLTSFHQRISDCIGENCTTVYQWNNYQLLPIWIIIHPKNTINSGNYLINFFIKINNNIVAHHIINLKILNHTLPNLKDQNYANLDLWQNCNSILNYYQPLTNESIIINNASYWKYLDPYLKHLTSIGQSYFHFDATPFLKVNVINNTWNFNFQPSLKIDEYLKKILNYGFKSLILRDPILRYNDFKNKMVNNFNLTHLTKDQFLTGYKQYQTFFYNYFKNNTWFIGSNRPKIFLIFDEVSPSILQETINKFKQLPGNKKIFYLACDINYRFWSNNILKILMNFNKISISYSYLTFLDSKSYQKVINFIDLRSQAKKETSIYSCTGDYPGNFIKSEPFESAIIPLYGLKAHIHNFLRWSYSNWPKTWSVTNDDKIKLADDPNLHFESGDYYLVYPLTSNNKVSLSPRM